MAKSFIRNFADQITGNTAKTTDTDIVQAVANFIDEQSKLAKYKREFEKYIQATLIYDNASHRFFDFLRSLPNSSWPQQRRFDAVCLDMARLRNEHLQNLNKQMGTNINSLCESFDGMKVRIDQQHHLQSDYDKIRRQYNSSIKRDEQNKIDRIKTELDELKSALTVVNKSLREELAKFNDNIQGNYTKTVVELTDMHGNFHQNLYQTCSTFVLKLQGRSLRNSDPIRNDADDELQSSTGDSSKKVPSNASLSSLSEPNRKNYKILHQARVIHDYTADNEDELDLVKDEFVSVISFDNEEENERDQGWEYAEKSDGTIGLFPVNFAVRLYDNEL